jgi:heat shock protein HslJ
MFTPRKLPVARMVGLSVLVLGVLALACGQLLGAATVAGAEEMAQIAQQPSATPRPAPVQAPAVPPPAGGAQTAPSATPDITQGLWLWQRNEMSDDSVIIVPDPSKYTVTFTPDGRLTVQADCNRAVGTYTRQGAQLTLKLGPTTLAACPPGSLGPQFLRDLGEVVTYVFDGEQLVLNMKVDSGNMIFSGQPPASLTGNQWRVQGINNGMGGITSVLADTQLTMTFGTDGRVSGNTGCNMFSGTYTVTGSGLTFGPLISTRRACLSDAANRQESMFLTALEKVAGYTLVGEMLTLADAAGTLQVRLVRPSIQPVPGASPSPAPSSLAPNVEQPENE